MGLDMYLDMDIDCEGAKGIIDIAVNEIKIPVNFGRLRCLTENIGYWRKAYAIHNWFVKNVQDGKEDWHEHICYPEDLQPLLEICKEIDAKAEIVEKPDYQFGVILNTWDMEKLLPKDERHADRNGVLYDFWYLNDARRTIDIITEMVKEDEILRNLGVYPEYYYYAA